MPVLAETLASCKEDGNLLRVSSRNEWESGRRLKQLSEPKTHGKDLPDPHRFCARSVLDQHHEIGTYSDVK